MNCTKNPRLRVKQQVEYAQRAFEINMEHMAIMLYALNQNFPQVFSKPKCTAFFEEYGHTVAQFEDEEERDYMIEQQLKEMPRLSWQTAENLVRHFAKRAETKLDKAIYANEGFAPLFALNIIMMLIQLHTDHGFGRVRMERLINAMMTVTLPRPLEWLAEIDVHISPDDDSAYELIKKLERKEKPVATVREQLDARRELEALRAYQNEMTGGINNG